MDKLNKLLEEYPNWKWDIDSLKFLRGFIKWLVDNDKIYRDKLEKKVLKEDLIRKFDEWLIMLLSISDHPIEDLCKLLK